MQTPDTKPGNYYVTVKKDNGDFRFLLGPFENDHQAALNAVEGARKMAGEIDPRADWYFYGTARLDLSQPGEPAAPVGILNKYFEALHKTMEAA